MVFPMLHSMTKGIVLAIAIWYWPNVVDIGPADFKLVKEHGYTHMKVDFWWHSLEPEQDKFEIDGLKKILVQAEKEGVQIILNLFGAPEPAAPHWAYEKFPDAWFTDHLGHRYGPSDGHLVLAGTGAYPGLCWDSPEVRQAAEKFFVHLIDELKYHRALAAWNIWAEPLTEPARTWGPDRKFCYCKHTQQAFREWLMRKFGSIDGLNAAWGTTYTAWRQVNPPVSPKRHHTPWMAWKTFLADRIAANMAWKYEIFKKHDPKHPICAYGQTFSGNNPATWDQDDWKMQQPLDSYGVSFYQAFHFSGTEVDPSSWMNHLDGIRSACEQTRQGQFFLGENQVSQVDEISQTPTWQMHMSRLAALSCGASGIWDWCLRLPYPGSWWASFGLARPDGTLGSWAEDIQRINALIGKISEHWEMPRVHSRVAIWFDPQTFYFCDAQKKLDLIKDSIQGFYKIAWDLNAPMDFVHADFITPETLAKYKTLLIPYQPTMTRETARILKEYVRGGGNIITEAGFGRQQEHGWAASQIPYEMQDVFGCKTEGIFSEENPVLRIGNARLHGTRFREFYEPTSGKVIGRHSDGSAAIIQTKYGNGTALIIGTLVGIEYCKSRNAELRKFFSPYISSEVVIENVLDYTGFSARIIHCRNNDILFLMNFSSVAENPLVKLERNYSSARNIDTGEVFTIGGSVLSAEVPPREALVLLLEDG